jgi:hypothetical protein
MVKRLTFLLCCLALQCLQLHILTDSDESVKAIRIQQSYARSTHLEGRGLVEVIIYLYGLTISSKRLPCTVLSCVAVIMAVGFC